MTSVKPVKWENQRSNLYKKRGSRNFYEPHQQTTTTEHQTPDLGQVHSSGFKRFNGTKPPPLSKI